MLKAAEKPGVNALTTVIEKKGTSMILCFYRQDAKNFKEKHKIIDVPFLVLDVPFLVPIKKVYLYVLTFGDNDMVVIKNDNNFKPVEF